MYKLIIFDLDGVLVDSCEIHRISVNKALTKNGYKEITLEDHYKKFNGLPTKVKLKILGFTPEQIEKINKDKQIITLEEIERLIYKDYQIMNLLRELSNYRLACVTNSGRDAATLLLKRVGILEFFSNIITSNDVKAPKPNCEGYIQAMVYAKAVPSETLIIEDSPLGIQGARNTGAKVLEVKSSSDVNFNLFREAGLL
jgi:HAD superfamily hydrolase (TIGR01509 family)